MSDSKDRTPPLSADAPSSEGQTLQTQHGSAPPLDSAETCIHSSAATVPLTEMAGQTIAGYVVEGELGRGGMGVVYKARQKGLGRLVALKMILHADHAGAEERLRFLREAEALARLRHENIVQIYEVGEHEGRPFISLEYVAGGSLDQHLKGTPLPPLEGARLVRQLADAMQAAHEAGIIHRDLKPANVLLASGGRKPPVASATGGLRPPLATPKITDFGLAKKQDEGGLSVSGAILGTPSYMAPEQAAGKVHAIDARTDVYALGAILYECLTGRPPFRAATAMDTMIQVISEEPVTVRSLQPGTPADLETICLKCLQKEPGRRYASAQELGADLGRLLRGEPVLARPVGSLERGWRWCRRNPVVAALVAAVLFLLVGGATVAALLAIEARRQAGEAQRETKRAKLAEEGQKTKTAEEKAQRELAEDRLYVSRLGLSLSYWRDNNVAAAWDKLEEAEEHRDTWEYRYLYTLFNRRGQRTFLGQNGTTPSVCFSPDGLRLASGGNGGILKVWDVATGQEVLSLTGAGGSVCFSPDGKRLAAGIYDGTVKVWDAQTGKVQLGFKAHLIFANSVVFSPDGKRLASAGNDRLVKVWDAASGQELLTLKGHTHYVNCVSFSPDGKRLVSGSQDKTVRVWDALTGQQQLVLQGHAADVTSVCFSPDGKRLASGSHDRTVKVWDSRTGREALTLEGHTALVTSVCFSPDGKRLASGSWDTSVRVWDPATGSQIGTFRGHTNWAISVCFSPDGTCLASGSAGGTIKVWDATQGQEAVSLRGHTDTVSKVCFSPDGKRLASASHDLTVKVWDVNSRQEQLSLRGHTKLVHSVVFSPDGKRLASGSGDGTVRVWDALTGQQQFVLQDHAKGVASVCFSPDGQRLAAGADNTVSVWDAVTGREQLCLKGHASPVWGVAFSPDGKRLATAGADQTVRIWDAQTGQQQHSLTGHSLSFIKSVCFSPDGSYLVSTSGDIMDNKPGELKMWDVRTGQEQLSLKGHATTVLSAVFSPDGKRLASGSGDRTVKVWDTQTGRELLTLVGHTDRVTSVVFSPDGKLIASGSADRTVRLWEAGIGQVSVPFKGHTNDVRSAVFSSDEKRLLSTSEDRTVRVWDAQTGKQQLVLKGHDAVVRSAVFSPDGKHIASSSDDLTVKVWDAVTGEEQLSLTGCSLLGFSGDNKKMASGYDDGTVTVWDAATREKVFTVKGHSKRVASVGFSADGKRFLSAAFDQTVKVWNATTWQEEFTLRGHKCYAQYFRLSADGKQLISWDVADRQFTWDIATGRLIADAPVQQRASSGRSRSGMFFIQLDGMVIRIHRLRDGLPDEPAGWRWWIDPHSQWHEAQAQQAWQAIDWFAANFHLGRLLRSRPWDAGLHVRHAHVLSQLERREEALAHYLQAMLLNPRVGLWPVDSDAVQRGSRAAQASDWPRAVAAFELAIHQPEAPFAVWADWLLAVRAAGSKDAPRIWRQLLDHFESKADTAWNLVLSCRDMPCEEPDAARVVKLAEGLVARQRNASNLDLLGSSLYRAGRFEEAARTLEEAIKVHGQGGYVDTWLFLAMTQHRLGRPEDVRQNLARFETWLKDRNFDTWQERERWRLLHEEARALVQSMPRANE